MDKEPIVEQCLTAGMELTNDPKSKDKKIETRIPCRKIEGDFCKTYLYPAAKWRNSNCPMAEVVRAEESKTKINPLKASKRAQKGT